MFGRELAIIRFSTEALKANLLRLENEWEMVQANHDRNAYQYLAAVFELVIWWNQEGEAVNRAIGGSGVWRPEDRAGEPVKDFELENTRLRKTVSLELPQTPNIRPLFRSIPGLKKAYASAPGIHSGLVIDTRSSIPPNTFRHGYKNQLAKLNPARKHLHCRLCETLHHFTKKRLVSFSHRNDN